MPLTLNADLIKDDKNEYDNEEQYYINALRTIVSQWNSDYYSPISGNEDYVYRFIRNYQYYFGKQINTDFKFFEQAAPGVNQPAVWVAGKKLKSLVEFMEGSFIQILQSYNVTTKSVSEAATNERLWLHERLNIEAEIKETLEQVEGMFGVDLRNVSGFRPESPEQVNDYMTNYQRYAEQICHTLITAVMEHEYSPEKLARLFVDALVCGVAGMRPRAINGKVKWQLYTPPYLIWDRVDSDTGEGMKWAGAQYWKSITEILQEHDLDEKTRSKVKKAGENSNYFNDLVSLTGGHGHVWQKKNNDVYTLVTEAEWIGTKKVKHKHSEDKNGNEHFTRAGEKDSGKNIVKKDMEVPYEGIMVGNKFLIEYGERKNQVRSVGSLAETEISFKIFTPGIKLGETNSVVETLASHQDAIDRAAYKIQLHEVWDKGRVFYFDTSKMDTEYTEDLVDVIQEATKNRIIPYNSMKDEEGFNQSAGKSFEAVDLSSIEYIPRYMEIIQFHINQMEEAVNIPKVALGQQQTYVSKDVQQSAVAQSTKGTLPLYNSFQNYINKILQYSANLSKVLMTVPDSYYRKFIIGESEASFLEETFDIPWEDFLIYVDINDVITETQRDRLIQRAEVLANNGMIGMDDVIQLEQAKTLSEARMHFEKKLKDQQREKMKMAQMQQQKEQAENQAERQLKIMLENLSGKWDVEEQREENRGKMGEKVFEKTADQLNDKQEGERNRLSQEIQNEQQGQTQRP